MARKSVPGVELVATSEDEVEDSESESESVEEIPGQVKPSLPSMQASSSESEESSQKVLHSPLKPPFSRETPSDKKGTRAQGSDSKLRCPESKVTGTKRGPQTDGSGDKYAKKGKMRLDILAESDPRKALFQRIWSEDDELAVLRGMIDFMEVKKVYPTSAMSSFHEFIKDKLQVNVTKSQLLGKIQRLKKKFAKHRRKQVGGLDRVFSKPHAHMSYQLSKKLWVPMNAETSVGGANSNVPKEKPVKESAGSQHSIDLMPKKVIGSFENTTDSKIVHLMNSMSSNSGPLRMEDMIQRIGDLIFEEGAPIEGSKEWADLKLKELHLHSKALRIKLCRTELVADFMKSKMT